MTVVTISEEILEKCPQIRLGCLQCQVQIQKEYSTLLSLIEKELSILQTQITVEEITKIPTISTSRQAYRNLGKEPARYRLSAEALLRRIIKGKGLYQVNNVVDLLNLVSAKSGFSIGGYDVEKIQGAIELGCGKTNEPYEAIGRGSLNIEFLPIFRDQKGAFGSPTSDSARTMVTPSTRIFLLIIFDFGQHSALEKTIDFAEQLLQDFAKGKDFQRKIII